MGRSAGEMEFSRKMPKNSTFKCPWSKTSLSITHIYCSWSFSCLFLSLITLCAGHTRREVGEEEESTSEATTTIHPDDIETGPSLGQILGVMTLVIIVFYIFGISWKVIKIYKGEYEPQEPVYLKYK